MVWATANRVRSGDSAIDKRDIFSMFCAAVSLSANSSLESPAMTAIGRSEIEAAAENSAARRVEGPDSVFSTAEGSSMACEAIATASNITYVTRAVPYCTPTSHRGAATPERK